MLSNQLDDLTGTTAQKSDVVNAIKSASETGMAKGFVAGQDDLRQEVDAMRVKTDSLQMHYTPMQRQLQAQSVDLSVLSKDLNSNTKAQRDAILAQNALTQALSNGLDVRAEDLAPAVARVLHDDFVNMLTELDGHVNAATNQLKLSQASAREAIVNTGAVAKSMCFTVIAALDGLGGTTVLLIALPGLWKLLALIPIVVTGAVLFLRKDK